MTQIPGAILAGGLATRMGGGDKCLLDLGGRPILSHVMDRIAPQTSVQALNANGPADRFRNFDLPVLPDPIDGFVGPLGGVLAALNWAADLGADQVVTVAADTPFFPTDLVRRLQGAVTNQTPIALAATQDAERGPLRQPTFGLWPVRLRENLAKALEDGVRKVVQWTDVHGTGLVGFDPHPIDPFFNINTQEDLEQARQLLAMGAT